MGLKLPPPNLKPDFEEQGRTFANQLANGPRPEASSARASNGSVIARTPSSSALPEATARWGAAVGRRPIGHEGRAGVSGHRADIVDWGFAPLRYPFWVASPNVLLIMTDEERYPPPYETAEVAEFRRTQMPARERVRSGGLELHRHYAGSVACVPSRATLFTGQYPSLHGVAKTSGIAKRATDPAMGWLDPDEVPTLGDWFRAGGYQTHYRGKWHVSHADLEIPGGHEGVMASDDDGRPIAHAVEAYRKADRLNPFGFSGWIGREPHGAAKSDCGTVRRRRVRRAGGRVVRRSGAGRQRRTVARCGVVREPPRHRVCRRAVQVAARLRAV